MNKNIKKMTEFSNNHYTYINQIFGDLTVRDIITELWTNKNDWKLVVEKADANRFESGFHHILERKNNGKKIKWCSVEEGYQNPVNKNDTLCQSYTLLKYRAISMDKKNSKKNQMKMIKLYRTIMKKTHFKKEIKQLIEDEDNKGHWKIYTEKNKKSHSRNMPMNYNNIMNNINKTLNDWEKFGFRYFIKKGK